jgi:hypothetical protein
MTRKTILALLLAAPLSAQSPRPADLIVTNARIYTVDDTRPSSRLWPCATDASPSPAPFVKPWP